MNWKEFKRKLENHINIIYKYVNAFLDTVIIYYKRLRMKEWLQKFKNENEGF